MTKNKAKVKISYSSLGTRMSLVKKQAGINKKVKGFETSLLSQKGIEEIKLRLMNLFVLERIEEFQ